MVECNSRTFKQTVRKKKCDTLFGYCEEQLPKQPVSRLLAVCPPTDGQLLAESQPVGFGQNK